MTSGIPSKRDLVGYGQAGPGITWPNDAKLALSFVLNFEEGGERGPLNGDPETETFLTESYGLQPLRDGHRSLNVESEFEYGPRAGFWRIMRLFDDMGMRFTTYAVGRSLEQVPEAGHALVKAGHEIASHGWRWYNYHEVPADDEEQQIRDLVRVLTEADPEKRPPRGWYIGRFSPQSRMLIAKVYADLGIEYLWDSDTYADDAPFWRPNPVDHSKGLVMLPYCLDCNDLKLQSGAGHGIPPHDWEAYLKDAFDVLYEEGVRGQPKMMSIGLHNRVVGRPGRIAALKRFMHYVKGKEGVWIATREEIARYWKEKHPYEDVKDEVIAKLGY